MNLADGTELREVPGLDGRYFASEDGRIWSSKRRKFRTASMQHNGYLMSPDPFTKIPQD